MASSLPAPAVFGIASAPPASPGWRGAGAAGCGWRPGCRRWPIAHRCGKVATRGVQNDAAGRQWQRLPHTIRQRRRRVGLRVQRSGQIQPIGRRAAKRAMATCRLHAVRRARRRVSRAVSGMPTSSWRQPARPAPAITGSCRAPAARRVRCRRARRVGLAQRRADFVDAVVAHAPPRLRPTRQRQRPSPGLGVGRGPGWRLAAPAAPGALALAQQRVAERSQPRRQVVEHIVQPGGAAAKSIKRGRAVAPHWRPGCWPAGRPGTPGRRPA